MKSFVIAFAIVFLPLAETTFSESYVDSVDAYYWIPDFPEDVVALDGKIVEMSGYCFPQELLERTIVLQPEYQDFREGGAYEIVALHDIDFGKWQKDGHLAKLKVTGKLHLNYNDLRLLNFNLYQVEVVEVSYEKLR